MVNRGSGNFRNGSFSNISPSPIQDITEYGDGFIPNNQTAGNNTSPVLQQQLPNIQTNTLLGGNDASQTAAGINPTIETAKARPTNSGEPISQSDLAGLLETDDEKVYAPNVLSNLYNYTYHFKFYVTSEEDLVVTAGRQPSLDQLHTLLENIPKIVIAESGVTAGFNIKDVEIENIMGPSFDSRNAGEIKNIRMTIVEPLGSSLLESMVTAASSLVVQNFSKMWYFLELSFMGYDESGEIINNALDTLKLQNKGKWIYKVSITNMEVHMDEGGATYNLSMIPYNMTAFDEGQCGCVPDNINVSGETIKEFCDDLAEKITKAWKDRYLDEIYKFNFKIHPIDLKGVVANPNNFKVVPSKDDPIDGLGLSQNSEGQGTGKNSGTINKGVHIADIISYLYAHCEEAQKLILDVNSPGVLDDATDANGNAINTASSDVATYNGKKYRVPVVPIIEPEIIVTGYDEFTGNYYKEITYHIYGYRNFTTNISTGQDQNVINDPKVSFDMVSDMIESKLLKKKYEHRFTGKNTEVIRFDMDYNFSYTAILPKFVGYNANIRSVSLGEKFNPKKDRPENIIEQAYNDLKSKKKELTIRQLQALLNNAQQTLDTYEAIANSPKNDTRYTDAERRDAKKQVELAKNIKLLATPQLQKVRKNSAARQKRTQDQLNSQARTLVFAEDLMPDSNPFKITYTQQNNESMQAIGTGLIGPWHRGASLVGALLNQIHTPTISALNKINLDIRGDPYWIGRSNLEKTAFHYQDEKVSIVPDFSLADSTFGDSAMTLIFRFPSKIDPDTGVPVIRRDDMFTGVYRVINVKNTFADGQFKQSLEAIKIDLARLPTKKK